MFETTTAPDAAPSVPAPETAPEPTATAPGPAPATTTAEPAATPSIAGGATAKPVLVEPQASTTEPAAATETAEPTAPAEPEQPLTYEAFKLPDGVTLNDADMGKFTEALGKYRAPQELGQELIDLYLTDRQQQVQQQRQQWQTMQDEWKQQVAKDPEIGGNRQQTVLNGIVGLFREFAPGELEQEVRQVLDMTGAGNHPAMIRFLNNIAKTRQAPVPIPAPAPRPMQAMSRAQRRYAGSISNQG